MMCESASCFAWCRLYIINFLQWMKYDYKEEIHRKDDS
jgi:hypothetical protein